MENLVIVESPTKARTLSKILGAGFRIEASMGHIRDLPKSELGIDVANNFEPKYIVPKDKAKRVGELKKLAGLASSLILATDPDREGEAIAWHISEILRSSKSKTANSKFQINDMKRVVFHEITPEAIKQAFSEPRDIDYHLVDAQQARRVLDRLVGYSLSPLLWKKVKSGLSAGRVQSVALRLVVEREQEIAKFTPVEYWSIEAELEVPDTKPRSKFTALLLEKSGQKLDIKTSDQAQSHLQALKGVSYKVSKVMTKQVKRSSAPPFTTSTMQQHASLKLGMSAKKTMTLAQFLYEHGLITYMRTDSVNLSPSATFQARSYINQAFGSAYLPEKPKSYKTKSKVAQEAHEAIRPSNIGLTSDDLKSNEGITREHLRLYDLIWKRMLASQMADAWLDQTTVDVGTTNDYLFRATGSVIKFEGWLRVYGKFKTNAQEASDDDIEEEKLLPKLYEAQALDLLALLPLQHFTEPPPRYNEASLIKKLEELGIGRPSTYAPIISTILDRYYVEKKDRRLFATELGIAVTKFLLENFPDIFEYSFTARMEDELDEIARGEREWRPTIKQFFIPFGAKVEVTEKYAGKVKVAGEVTDKICPECGKPLLIKFGRFGKFLACSGFPECKHTESLEEKVNAKCPLDSGDILMRKTRKGKPFYGCKNWPVCKYASWTKPKDMGDKGKARVA